MKIKLRKIITIQLILMLGILLGCSTQHPVLYPNSYYKEVGKEQADHDIAQAMELADKTDLNATNWGQDVGKAAGATALGAGVGTATGAILGGVGVGAICGAIGGFAISIFWWIFSSHGPSTLYKNYVNKNLQDKGYSVIGWD